MLGRSIAGEGTIDPDLGSFATGIHHLWIGTSTDRRTKKLVKE